jgi:thiosulfate/3-mercaptopyruvate sulfurtransferase
MNLIYKGLAALLLLLPALGWAAPAFLVDSEWLAERIDEENLIVLEARYHPHRHYTVGHIPGTVQVQRFRDALPLAGGVRGDPALLGGQRRLHPGAL